MTYVICYDITDDKRRSHLVNTLLDYGSRIQESVFYADLQDGLFKEMRGRVEKVLARESDVVHIFPLCQACDGKRIMLGKATMPAPADYYVV